MGDRLTQIIYPMRRSAAEPPLGCGAARERRHLRPSATMGTMAATDGPKGADSAPEDRLTTVGDAASETVATLVARGDYRAAAVRAESNGDLRTAIALLERIWRFSEALPLAERLGDRPLAIRVALDARADERAVAVSAAIPDDDRDGLLRAAAVW